MKKFLVLFLSTILSISSVSFLYAGENDYASRMYVISEFVQSVGRNNFTKKESDLTKFSDSGKIDDQYYKDIEIAVANNVVNGYSDGTIKPDGLITRAEAAVILSKCIGSVEITQSEKQFTDVPQWAKQDVNKLTQAGIISGYSDTIFGSGDNITVKQVKILTEKIEGIVNKNDPKDDFYKYVNNKFERNYSLDGKQSYDYFNIVQELIDDRVKKIILSSSAKSNENQTRINDLYNLYMDTDSRNSLGIKPIKQYLDKVDSIKSVREIPELESYLYKELYLSPLFNIYVD